MLSPTIVWRARFRKKGQPKRVREKAEIDFPDPGQPLKPASENPVTIGREESEVEIVELSDFVVLLTHNLEYTLR